MTPEGDPAPDRTLETEISVIVEGVVGKLVEDLVPKEEPAPEVEAVEPESTIDPGTLGGTVAGGGIVGLLLALLTRYLAQRE